MVTRNNLLCVLVLSVIVSLASVSASVYNEQMDNLVKARRSLLANGLGNTPPMGWNSWNYFYCDVTERVIRESADALISTGLDKLGYKYVNIGLSSG